MTELREPWAPSDATKHSKAADTPKKQQTWAKVANDALKRCQEKGGSDCEASAIKQANSVVAKMGEAYDEWFDGQDEATQNLIDGHIHGLKTALESERKLRREAERKLREPEETMLEGDFVKLTEKSVRGDGTIPVKIIAPGWGTSGYYPPDVLARDGPKVFEAGTKMFWDHPTEEEEAARPEGSLRNLAGELARDAYWDESSVLGPGLYADAHVFGAFQGAIDELAPHIGVSIRGRGKAEDGEADGRSGRIVKEIATIQSVDFVTMPGAGGQVLQLFESARDASGVKPNRRNKKMEELRKLQEANKQLEDERLKAEMALDEAEKAKDDALAEVAKLKEGDLLREAKDYVSEMLASLELHELTKDRLIEKLSKNPPIKDGALDKDAYAKAIDEAAKDAVEYIAKVTGSGVIKGMGGAGDTGADEDGAAKLKDSFKFKFMQEGFSAEEAEKMADNAVLGR